MSDLSTNRPIRAELLAEKMRALRDFELPELAQEIERTPRLVEALWHIQWASHADNYAGGLARFAADLIADSADLIGTPRIVEQRKRNQFTTADAREIFQRLPHPAQEEVAGIDGAGELLACMADAYPTEDEWRSRLADDALVEIWDDPPRCSASPDVRLENQRRVETLLQGASLQTFVDVCTAAARRELPNYLRGLCEQSHFRFSPGEAVDGWHWKPQGLAPWYFAEIGTALLRFIDRQKAAIAHTLAETEITTAVFQWLGRAQTARRAVRIIGNSRFGKTEAVRAWCRMNPGLARLVNTPDSNGETDLLREVAIALGIETSARQSAARLRETIAFVIRHGRLLLAFDESHLLFPVRFSATTAPARLNWVRRSVLDAGVGCAFIATPQGYDGAKRRFVKKTAYTIEQFEERILKTVHLPEELPTEDLLRVARIHFADLHEDYLLLVVNNVRLAGRSFVSDLEKVATLAREYAAEAGRREPSLAQIKAAIADVLPAAAAPRPPAPAPVSRPATKARTEALQRSRTADADPLLAPATEAPSRINFDQLDRQESLTAHPA